MRENEEDGNAMKFLENKTYDSKRDMDILEAIDEVINLNKRKVQIKQEDLLKNLAKERELL